MYLKRLDLQGFKSFPEKVKLEFNKGVTAVVGPNGSGKSNVSDAVRWVLGEQRAKSLRGDKMEDVIFAGTETRKPLGFAEVSITLDNQDHKLPLDYTEIQVTRRVFRSGESEYRINGTACRLKDIQELFMDTGVGREGYSIIGQGRIDEILSAKGDERRRIFEEAAGIVKYKSRRNEAASKLDKEQQNLVRVDDIITELEVQLAPLEEQSERAKEYLLLKEELKQAEVSVFCTDMDRMEGQLRKLEEDEKNADAQIQALKDAGEKARQESTTFRQRVDELDGLLQTQNQQIADLRQEKEKKEGEIRLAQEQKQNDEDNIKRLQMELAQKEEKKKANTAQKELYQSRLTALQMEMKRLQENLDEVEEEYSSLNTALSQNEAQAENFKDEIFEQIKKSTEAKGEIAKIVAMQEQFEGRKEQILHEKETLEARIHQIEVHTQALEKQEEELLQTIAFLEKSLQALAQDRTHALAEKEQAQNTFSLQGKRISETQSRLSLLKEMEKDHDGFYQSVKSLLSLSEQEKTRRGICGAVGQLLKVDALYEVAIEAALGGAVQNVVTETEENARDAIGYLKQHKLGRATFLPLTAVKGRTFDTQPPILNEAGVIGVAHTLISFDEKYRQIATSLLGRTIFVETLEKAVALAKKYRHQYRMVTLDGDILNPGGAMTGGSAQKKATHIFGRSREIHQLEEVLAKDTALAEEMQEKMELATEDLQDIEQTEIEKKMELQRLLFTRTTRQEEQGKSQEDQKETSQRLERILLEENQLERQISRAEEDVAQNQGTIDDTETALNTANEQLVQYQGSVSEEKERRNALMEEITQIKMSLSANGQSVQGVEESIQRLEIENREIIKQQEANQGSIQSYQRSGSGRDAVQAELRTEIRQLDAQEQTLQTDVTNATEEKGKASHEAVTAEGQMQTHRESVAQMENERFRIETKREKTEEEKIRLTTQMWEEYEMTYRMAKEYTQRLPEDREKHPAREWRAKIKALGDVNVGAIEQYREVRERFTFLSKQRADIIEAEEKLCGIIEELTILMEKQFKEEFDKISENFSRVFRELFGGGTAYLKLVESESVLESPIEIVAQPPGKNLQNMQLLSGGERALTAIAILFSILELKPSPFCILDEIEAALDDANVGRYAEYLKKFSNETQFIVITHRKGTMEYADVLYGVTMQEKGVSKLISIDFTNQKSEQAL